MTIILYGALKFIAYCAWGFLGFRLHNVTPSTSKVISLGFTRWMLGLFVGVVIFFGVSSISREQADSMYYLVYFPVRFIEWMFIGKVFFKAWPNQLKDPKFYAWIVGAVLLSFAIDILFPDAKDLHFCVGRCFG